MENDKSQGGELTSSQLIEIIKETNPKLAASLAAKLGNKEISDQDIIGIYIIDGYARHHRKLIQDGNDPRYTKNNKSDIPDIKDEEYARVHLWHYPDNQVKVTFTIPRHQKEKKLDDSNRHDRVDLPNQKEKRSRKLEDMLKEGRPGYGGVHNATEFDYKKAQKVRRRAAAIEKEYSKDNLRFITLTIPASTHNAKQTIAQYSSYVNSRFDDFVKNTAKRLDYEYPLAILKVIEMQKRKAQKVHNFYHWHIVLGCWSQELLSEIDNNLRNFWYKLLIDIEKLELEYREKTIDLFERHDGGTWRDNPDMLRIESAKIKQSVVAYLSKYLSKSNSKIYDPTGNEYNSQDNESYAPARWYTANDHVRELEKKFTTHWSSGGLIPVETAKEIIDMVTNEHHKQDDKMRISWYKNFGNTILGCSVFARNGKQLLADLWDYLSNFDFKDNHVSKQKFDEYANTLVNIRKKIVDIVDNVIEYERHLDVNNAYQSWFKELINPVSFSKMLRGFHYTLAKINPIKYKDIVSNWESKYRPLLEPTKDDYLEYERRLATKAQRLAQT